MLSKFSNMTIDWEIVPDTSCIISIPKMNFKSGVMPGTFVPIHGGPPDDSYFEYEMIGDYSIQAAYYVVGGVEYVAGLCIYLEDPYQEPSKYNQSIIWKLIKSPDYWSTWNLKKETMHIIKKEWSQRPQVVSSNKYGEQFHWVYWEELKSWALGARKGTPIDREFENEEDPKVQSKFMNVRMCETEGNMVVIAERNGRKVHVNWNKEMKEMEFTTCDSCQDDPPPSYQIAVPKKEILFDYRLW
ncbi:unnamed protein product [Caenorhabditis brenneri]